MLIGGDYYKHSGIGKEDSWLFTDSPEKYLLKEEHLNSLNNESSTESFIIGASKADIFNVFIELPWMWDAFINDGKGGISIKRTRGPAAYYKRPEWKWSESQRICLFSWVDIPQKWDLSWFKDRLKTSLSERIKDNIRKKTESEKDFILCVEAILDIF